MNRMTLRYIIICITGLFVLACAESRPNDGEINILDGNYILTINTQTFQVKFGNSENHSLVPYAADSGLFLDGAPIVSVAEENRKTTEEKIFQRDKFRRQKSVGKSAF